MESKPSQATQYDRRLGLFDGTMMTVGGIIGAGIFLNPAIVAQRVGTAPLTIAAWVVGGLIALAGAFCFAELGSRFPRAGGGYVYLRDAFGPLPAFLYGWTLLLVINSGALAAVAAIAARYSSDLVGLPTSAVLPLTLGFLGLFTAVNYFGICDQRLGPLGMAAAAARARRALRGRVVGRGAGTRNVDGQPPDLCRAS